ncbi:MAG TPA: vitamin K epoxide reductase family protein [Gemmatimonadales bacterium]|nr:vitamin K epoxide reductase family protein [Gemmatimonadales bacterium]
MSVAMLSLIAGLSAVYLHLYKLGRIGPLSCSSGGCERAMFSRWGWFFGFDVATIGMLGYALLLATSLISLRPRWQDSSGPVNATLFLALSGFVFTLRLKIAEFVILRTFCPWCAISAICITVITLLAFFDWRTLPPRGPAGPISSRRSV